MLQGKRRMMGSHRPHVSHLGSAGFEVIHDTLVGCLTISIRHYQGFICTWGVHAMGLALSHETLPADIQIYPGNSKAVCTAGEIALRSCFSALWRSSREQQRMQAIPKPTVWPGTIAQPRHRLHLLRVSHCQCEVGCLGRFERR